MHQRLHLLGIFDGHGLDGTLAAQHARDTFVNLIKSRVDHITADKADVEAVLVHLFEETDQELRKAVHVDSRLSGTTATVLLVDMVKKRITVANTGDSKAVIGRTDKSGNLEIETLTMCVNTVYSE